MFWIFLALSALVNRIRGWGPSCLYWADGSKKKFKSLNIWEKALYLATNKTTAASYAGGLGYYFIDPTLITYGVCTLGFLLWASLGWGLGFVSMKDITEIDDALDAFKNQEEAIVIKFGGKEYLRLPIFKWAADAVFRIRFGFSLRKEIDGFTDERKIKFIRAWGTMFMSARGLLIVPWFVALSVTLGGIGWVISGILAGISQGPIYGGMRYLPTALRKYRLLIAEVAMGASIAVFLSWGKFLTLDPINLIPPFAG